MGTFANLSGDGFSNIVHATRQTKLNYAIAFVRGQHYLMNLTIANNEEVLATRQTKLNNAMACGLATISFGNGKLITSSPLPMASQILTPPFDAFIPCKPLLGGFLYPRFFNTLTTVYSLFSLTFQQTPYLHSSTFLYFRPHSPPSPNSIISIISSSRFPKYSPDCNLTYVIPGLII
ncbi:hypothetical protein L1987_75486 [Smallanthus sonchifolius]|uniref:Uncharacterized protein n=1 Tax=Smallanthus sonchifolius TaxID=185202 RepID=A0ACB9A5Y4_9ASTR|nr:hypothetical protein L1987_75486 [Smallanthus sonchifolius]